MTVGELRSDLLLTTDTPYLALTGELWGVCCKDIGENWLRYKSTALYFETTDSDNTDKAGTQMQTQLALVDIKPRPAQFYTYCG